jgi:hypothetical protein
MNARLKVLFLSKIPEIQRWLNYHLEIGNLNHCWNQRMDVLAHPSFVSELLGQQNFHTEAARLVAEADVIFADPPLLAPFLGDIRENLQV